MSKCQKSPVKSNIKQVKPCPCTLKPLINKIASGNLKLQTSNFKPK